MHLTTPSSRSIRASTVRRQQRGLSIVELLIGIAVGLFVLAGATMVASNQIVDNKRLLLETQIQQDMRTAMDVIVRDVRRSGYSYHADVLQPIGAALATPIGYQPAGVMDEGNPLLYTYSNLATPADNKTASAAVAADSPDFKGFRLRDEVIQVQLGLNNWQALTDTGVVRITKFNATAIEDSTALPTCDTPGACPELTGCGSPRIVTRYIDLEMEGEARHDPRVKRRLDARVRVRNDEVCL
jgi:prepilin peptidase dependent protein B